MALVYRRQPSYCGINVCPFAFICKKKKMPGSVALCSKYLSAFFYSFKYQQWIDVYQTQPAAVHAFSILFLHARTLSPPEERAGSVFLVLLERCREATTRHPAPHIQARLIFPTTEPKAHVPQYRVLMGRMEGPCSPSLPPVET